MWLQVKPDITMPLQLSTIKTGIPYKRVMMMEALMAQCVAEQEKISLQKNIKPGSPSFMVKGTSLMLSLQQ